MVNQRPKSLVFGDLAKARINRDFRILYHYLPSAAFRTPSVPGYSGHKLATWLID